MHHIKSKGERWARWTALIAASHMGFTDIVRDLIAADRTVEHLGMQSKYGKAALDYAKNDEIKALLRAAEAE